MKRTVTAALLLAMIASATAFADFAMADTAKGGNAAEKPRLSQDRRDERRDDRWDRRDERRDDRWDRDDRRDWRRHNGRVWHGHYHRPHGFRPHHWRRGERLPVAYYARPYVIRDYDRCHLRHPPRGYHWVRVDRDVVLAAIATGVILDVLSDHFH